jgi:hypothetical protein
MKTNFNMVCDFMTAFGQKIRLYPEMPSEKEIELRVDLIEEEFTELKEAIKNNDIVEVADALTDILYVVYGAALTWGIDINECFDEVHYSNMSKLGDDGKPIYNNNGKVMKGPNYVKPDLEYIIRKQKSNKLEDY